MGLLKKFVEKGPCVRNLLFILPIIASSACSFANTQRHDSHLHNHDMPASEHTAHLSANDSTSYKVAANKIDNNAIIHTAMSPIESPTAVTTIRQQLRADPQWNALANEVVYCIQSLSVDIDELKKHSLYIAQLENPSPELKAFRSMVMTKLVQNGFSVTFNPKNAYYLTYEIISKELSKELEELSKELNTESNDELVVRVDVIVGEKTITKSHGFPNFADSEKREEILRVVRKHYF